MKKKLKLEHIYEVYTVNFNVKLNRYMEVIEHD
jgi:hypothetical protein